MTGGPLLAVEGVSAGYGAALILHEASLVVGAGEVVAIVGPNGAGKTTLLRAVTGRLPVRAGTVRVDGARVDGRPPYRIAALGVATVPEGRRLFDDLTVAENVELGAYRPAARAHAAATRARLEALFPLLRDRRDQPAGRLSGGEQQVVALARGLMGRPRLLVLDDPFLGLAGPAVTRVAAALRGQVAAEGTAVLAAGQHVRRLLAWADRAYVLAQGRVVAAGSGGEVLAGDVVRRLLFDVPSDPGAAGGPP